MSRRSYKLHRKKHASAATPIPDRDSSDQQLIGEYDVMSKDEKSRASLLYALSPLELAALKSEMDARSTPAVGGCILYDGNSGNGRGYVQLSRETSRPIFWAAKQRKLIATHVALASAGHLKPTNMRRPQASHLCKTKACVNPEHLVWEEEEVNQSRDNCKLFIEVTCSHCSQVTTASVCKHSPLCL